MTGRPRRTGWFDAVALARSIINNGITGLCVTKLDVLDGVDPVKLCVAYEHEGEFEKARKAYERALELDPENQMVRQNYELFKEINDRTSRRGSR